MFFVSKKKYNELLEQKKDFERIATNAVAQNSRLLDEWGAAIEEKKNLRELNLRLIERNEGLLTRVKELEKERDMWRERAEEENRQAEIYRGMLKCAEVG